MYFETNSLKFKNNELRNSHITCNSVKSCRLLFSRGHGNPIIVSLITWPTILWVTYVNYQNIEVFQRCQCIEVARTKSSWTIIYMVPYFLIPLLMHLIFFIESVKPQNVMTPKCVSVFINVIKKKTLANLQYEIYLQYIGISQRLHSLFIFIWKISLSNVQ